MAAMLDCQDADKEGDNCTHCHTGNGNNRLYWGIQLDQDLLETIVSIYPEWFKDCNMNLAVSDSQRQHHPLHQNGVSALLENSTDLQQQQALAIIPLVHQQSRDNHDVVKAEIEDTSLQKIIDRNKESLKVKLMLRRPINQLIDQGILPPLRSPSAFHEQRLKLERAKMGDLLKSKIQKRPDRQALIQQHILEDTAVDPSLQDRQRQLKKARLADDLNSQLSQRPGPLELVKGNILKTDEILAQAVREGALSFRSTIDASPPTKISFDEDSLSDANSPSSLYFNEHSQGSFPSLEASECSPITVNHGSPCSAKTSFSMSPPSSVSSPLSVMQSVVSPQSQSDQVSDMIVNGLILHNKESPVKNRKKAKPKTQPKARTIKFHEYKGPPNAQKNAPNSANSSAETSYDLLLQQQQLFLQWQLEWQQKYPQSVIPPAQKPNGDQSAQTLNQHTPSNQNIQHFESPISPQKVITKLEDLKVSDLKAELKKRNLPVSGPKPVLIERLKLFAESSQNHLPVSSSSVPPAPNKTTPVTTTTSNSIPFNTSDLLMDNMPSIPAQTSVDMQPLANLSDHENPELTADGVAELLSALDEEKLQDRDSRPQSAIPMDLEPASLDAEMVNVTESSVSMLSNEDIVQLQQRCIEKLQRELERSQMQLQQQAIVCPQPPTELSPVTETSSICVPQPANTKLINPEPTTLPVVTPVEISPTPVPTSIAQTLSVSDSKFRQRQIIHQQLQQKIHQQKQQQHLLLQQKQQQQHHQHQQPQSHKSKHKKVQSQDKNIGKSSRLSSCTSSSNTNSTLTALLESQPINSPLNINLNNADEARDASVSFQKTILASQTRDTPFPNDDDLDATYPGVVPLHEGSTHGDLPRRLTSSTEITKTTSLSLPNSIADHRTLSLPSFSALVNSKPPPSRSNTDPQFLLTRPPPDYDEATRQLNKIKQQYLQSQDINDVPGHAKKRKSSVKCQAVDDVLEILIKNGELPPSAAQEPPTPSAPLTPKNELSSSSLFNESIATTTVTMPTNAVTSPITSAMISVPSCDAEPVLHMTPSLQSVLDMTPPSSAGFGEQANTTQSSLDFDFHLDVEDIEVMDLDSLTREEHQNVSNRLDSTLSDQFSKPTRTAGFSEPINNLTNINGSYLLASDLSDFHGKGMDTDIIEWLDLLGENNGNVPAPNSASHFHHPSYSIGNEHDPMLSNVGNSRDSLDLFSVDDMDFKPSENSILSWDKTDFTT